MAGASACRFACLCIHVCMCVRRYVCMHACMHIYVYVCVYPYVPIDFSVCVHAGIFILILQLPFPYVLSFFLSLRITKKKLWHELQGGEDLQDPLGADHFPQKSH